MVQNVEPSHKYKEVILSTGSLSSLTTFCDLIPRTWGCVHLSTLTSKTKTQLRWMYKSACKYQKRQTLHFCSASYKRRRYKKLIKWARTNNCKGRVFSYSQAPSISFQAALSIREVVHVNATEDSDKDLLPIIYMIAEMIGEVLDPVISRTLLNSGSRKTLINKSAIPTKRSRDSNI